MNLRTAYATIFLVLVMSASASHCIGFLSPSGGLGVVPSGNQILERLAHSYSSCSSYRDKGTITVFSALEGEQVGSTIHFVTYFKRSGEIKFEIKSSATTGDDGCHEVLVRKDMAVRVWSEYQDEEIARIRSYPSLSSALHMGWVPLSKPVMELLEPSRLPPSIRTSATKIERVTEFQFRGRPCYTVETRDRSVHRWITVSKDSFQLLRLRSINMGSYHSNFLTIEYDAQLDRDFPFTLPVDITPEL